MILQDFPQNFFEIFFFVFIGTITSFILHRMLFCKTLSLKEGVYININTYEITPFNFIQKNSEECLISNSDSEELVFIPENYQAKFIFDENEEPFVYHSETLFYFTGIIEIKPTQDIYSCRSYSDRVKKGKKVEISQPEMRKLVERALDKAIHFGDLGYFPKLLKNEIAHFTCFHHEDISINEDFLLTNKKK